MSPNQTCVCLTHTVYTSGSQSGRYRPPGVEWTIQGVDK